VIPSRPLEKMVDVLLRADRSFMRTERERLQADDVYKGSTLRVKPTDSALDKRSSCIHADSLPP
jgi:hypothetical protein